MKRLQRFQALFLFFTVKLPEIAKRKLKTGGQSMSASFPLEDNFSLLIAQGVV